MMSKGQIFNSRKNFVEDGIGAIMQVQCDFYDIKYARTLTEAEYIRISDILGRSVCLDITGMTLEDIYKDTCRVVLINDEKRTPPKSVVTDMETLRKIAPLFN